MTGTAGSPTGTTPGKAGSEGEGIGSSGIDGTAGTAGVLGRAGTPDGVSGTDGVAGTEGVAGVDGVAGVGRMGSDEGRMEVG